MRGGACRAAQGSRGTSLAGEGYVPEGGERGG